MGIFSMFIVMVMVDRAFGGKGWIDSSSPGHGRIKGVARMSPHVAL